MLTLYQQPQNAPWLFFRESYKLPTEDDLLDPRNSEKDLQWLEFIYNNMVDKSDYISAVVDALKTLKDRTKILQEYEGTIVTNVIRLISQEQEVKTVFDKMLKEDNTIISQLLRAISAKPSI